MDKKWTSDQNNAINATGGTVLVSAAAGSGKTAVLVQRIINRITNSENPIDITEFLIVTFTKASAQEMKNRISKKLSEMILHSPQDENLQRQKMLLKYAQIGTIDSFCKTFAEENFYKLGISPKINIATENEMEILKKQALTETLEYFYNLKDKNFESTFDILAGEKNDDDLEEIIKTIRGFLTSMPFPEKWMEEKLKLYENENISSLPWVKIITEHAKSQVDISQKMLFEILKISKSNEKIEKAYGDALAEDLGKIQEISENLNSNSWDKAANAVNSLKFAKFKPLKGEDTEHEKNLISQQRSYVKDTFKKLKEYFIFSEKNIKEDLKSIQNVVTCLFEITKHFEKKLNDLKSAENVAEFVDLEHWTLKLLTQKTENGEFQKSALAKEISDRYTEIMIDEYQDINDIQDTIFRMISKNETNIFAVGDVKQSIYKFRNSKPEIFLSKKDKYKPYDKNLDLYPTKITLGKNFRSKGDIIDVINFIFRSIMSKRAGNIEYNEEESLFAGAEFEKNNDISTELIIINSADNDSDEAAEADFIAKKIMKMISEKYQISENGKTRNATYSDFCILLRKFKNSANIYKNELAKCGIPVKTESSEKFLETPEISTILSLLKIINNPVQDIPLISSLLSPIYNFSLDDLSEIRILDRELPFYFALKKYSESGENENLKNRISSFMKDLEEYREFTISIPCNELIDFIYRKTDYPAICMAMENGENKKANLMLLSEYAKKFENQYHKGLFGFLKFIENIKNKDGDLPAAPNSNKGDNSVKIMSIHKSKGLEFPICIVAGCAKSGETNKNVIYLNTDAGVGIKLKNNEGTVKLPNVVTSAIALQNKIESTSEELRILYVALTRAKQKLIMVAGTENPEKTIQKHLLILNSQEKIPYQYVLKQNTIFDWLTVCIAKSNIHNKLCGIANLPELISEKEYPDILNWNIEYVSKNENIENANETAEFTDSKNESKKSELFKLEENSKAKQILEIIKKRFDFKYSENDLTNLPLKVSASQLTKDEAWRNYIASSKPSFISKTGITPADRGNAMHKLMCYIDFNNTYKNGINSELQRLKSNGFLDETEILAINKKHIENFIFGDIGSRIRKSPKVYREHRFSVTIPSKYLTEFNCSDNHYTVMQGAIDCAFSENEKYVIIDYKTDLTSSINELWEKYSKQLKLYKFALEQAENVDVSELILYSFNLNESYIKKY